MIADRIPLGPITIINGQYTSFHRARAFVVHFAEIAVDCFMKTWNQWPVYILFFEEGLKENIYVAFIILEKKQLC